MITEGIYYMRKSNTERGFSVVFVFLAAESTSHTFRIYFAASQLRTVPRKKTRKKLPGTWYKIYMKKKTTILTFSAVQRTRHLYPVFPRAKARWKRTGKRRGKPT